MWGQPNVKCNDVENSVTATNKNYVTAPVIKHKSNE